MISNEFQYFATGLANETLERHMLKTRNQEGGKFRQLFDRTLIIKPKIEFYFDNYRGLERDGIVPEVRQKSLPEAKLTLTRTRNICLAGEKERNRTTSIKRNSPLEDKSGFI